MEARFIDFLVKKANVSLEVSQQLMKYVRTLDVPKGSYLLKSGEMCNETFFVEKGLLRYFSIDSEGKEHIIQFAPEGWLISDRESIFFNQPSNYFIDAVEDSRVVVFGAAFLENACKLSPEFSRQNELLLQNHIRRLQDRIRLLIGASAEVRYLDFITLYPNLLLRAPQWMIASYLGITPESLSRVRKELARKNFRSS